MMTRLWLAVYVVAVCGAQDINATPKYGDASTAASIASSAATSDVVTEAYDTTQPTNNADLEAKTQPPVDTEDTDGSNTPQEETVTDTPNTGHEETVTDTFNTVQPEMTTDASSTGQPGMVTGASNTGQPGMVTDASNTWQPGMVTGASNTGQPGMVTDASNTWQPGMVTGASNTGQPGMVTGGYNPELFLNLKISQHHKNSLSLSQLSRDLIKLRKTVMGMMGNSDVVKGLAFQKNISAIRANLEARVAAEMKEKIHTVHRLTLETRKAVDQVSMQASSKINQLEGKLDQAITKTAESVHKLMSRINHVNHNPSLTHVKEMIKKSQVETRKAVDQVSMQASSKNKQLEGKLHMLMTRIDQLEGKLDHTISNTSEKCHMLMNRIDQLEGKLDHTISNTSEKSHMLMNRIDQLEGKLDLKIANISERSHMLMNRIDQLEGKLDLKIANISERSHMLMNRIDQLEGKLDLKIANISERSHMLMNRIDQVIIHSPNLSYVNEIINKSQVETGKAVDQECMLASSKVEQLEGKLHMLMNRTNQVINHSPNLTYVLEMIEELHARPVRLVGGSNETEGRVEVRVNGIWGTVCDDSFDTREAKVVCRMLGFTEGGAGFRCLAAFGQGSGPILLGALRCTGDEHDIRQCPRASTFHCGHSEDAGVICQP